MIKRSARSPREIQELICREDRGEDEPLVVDNLVSLLSEMSSEIHDLRMRLEVHATVFRAQEFIINDDEQRLLSSYMPRRVEIDAKDAVESFGGVYQLEYSRDHAFRWTGPGPSFGLVVWIDRSLPILLHASLMSYGCDENRGSIKLFVDGVEVALHFGDSEFWSEPFGCHSEVIRTRLDIVVPNHSSQQDRRDDDPRYLGIAFTKIRLSSGT